eukprot:1813493-Pleurochrysis_carterae.AAC.1
MSRSHTRRNRPLAPPSKERRNDARWLERSFPTRAKCVLILKAGGARRCLQHHGALREFALVRIEGHQQADGDAAGAHGREAPDEQHPLCTAHAHAHARVRVKPAGRRGRTGNCGRA